MTVYVCFELNSVDAPILRGVRTYAHAMLWRDADLANRFIVGCAVDVEAEVIPPRDLFEWAQQASEA